MALLPTSMKLKCLVSPVVFPVSYGQCCKVKWSNGYAVCCWIAAELIGGDCLYSQSGRVLQDQLGPRRS
ncbi:hypothetical protein JZ751_022414 [Albula glossodonta]|uniref:Uncharacterized protein n=1 Tax=Albula glossodonta TaxID=121402 RepID=A0A8T2MSR2_9TELE|nr:hypothetical protein JZ751_022414 [Albula glossodonta]